MAREREEAGPLSNGGADAIYGYRTDSFQWQPRDFRARFRRCHHSNVRVRPRGHTFLPHSGPKCRPPPRANFPIFACCYSSLWPSPIWSPRKANNDGATLPLSSRKSGRGRSTLVIPSESVVSANPPILVNSFSPPAPSPGEQRALLVTYFYLPQQKRTAAGVPSIAHLSVSICLCERRIAAEREI